MLTLRRRDECDHSQLDWLDSYHTFSYALYWAPQNVGFSDLRVINDDTVQPACGFDEHPHRDIEILSYVLDGSLEHRDSEGNHNVIRSNDVQLMRCGHGISHSEYNPSKTKPAHFITVWIVPALKDLQPGYQQTHIAPESRRGTFRLIASSDGREGSLQVTQDIRIFARIFDPGETTTFKIPANRYAYVFVAQGSVTLNGIAMQTGDGVKAVEETVFKFAKAEKNTEVLFFDLRPQALSEMG